MPEPVNRRRPPSWTRRGFIAGGIAAGAAVVAAGLELVDHGVLPGKHALDEIDGACSVTIPKETFAATGPTVRGQFYSRARGRQVGYSIAYPPAYKAGSNLPLCIYLYPDGGDQDSPLGRLTPAEALAGDGLAPMALVTCDGGRDLYWNPHPGDDPMSMLIDEVIPMCQSRGLGTKANSVGAIGVSMGGYGVLLLAERYPSKFAAVAAISPAIWTSYVEAAHVNPAAYASAAAFARADVITHAKALRSTPVRIASGSDDPFHAGVVELIRKLDGRATVDLSSGCHDTSYFASQQQQSLQFVGRHLAG